MANTINDLKRNLSESVGKVVKDAGEKFGLPSGGPDTSKSAKADSSETPDKFSIESLLSKHFKVDLAGQRKNYLV